MQSFMPQQIGLGAPTSPRHIGAACPAPQRVKRCFRLRRCQAAATADAISSDTAKLPSSCRRCTAQLNVPNPNSPSGSTTVHILSISHVSSSSCEDIRAVIRGLSPDVVMVEICKDRLGLLATPPPPGERVWHSSSIKVIGVPDLPGFPTSSDLLPLLKCKPGRPFSSTDIEDDARSLQATGLFRTVRPSALSGTSQDAPLFVVAADAETSSGIRLDTVPPLNSIEFRCDVRSLPPISSFSLRVESHASDAGVELAEEKSAEIREKVTDKANREDAKTMELLMEARACILSAAESPVPLFVQFDNVESGVVEAVVRLQTSDGFVSGLEGSASGGMGFGIEPFKAPRSEDGLKFGLTSMVPAEALQRLARQQYGEASHLGKDASMEEGSDGTDAAEEALPAAAVKGRGRTQWREWGWREVATAADEDPEPQPLKDLIASYMTGWFSQLQTRAAQTTGVDPGAAWRIAMQEAAGVGAAQVILGDRPAFVTQRRLAQGIWDALAPRVAVGLVLLNMSVVAGAANIVPASTAYQALGVSVLGTLASLAPVAGPFYEMWRFSSMSAKEIEDAVKLPEDVQQNLDQPLQLYGEDALLNWPGASESILAERDSFMTRAIAAAALGSNGQVPAFVMDEVDGITVMRYMMADGAPNKSAPAGRGDGAYRPLENAESVVAVVGSAHVRGMCNLWDESTRDVSVDRLLQS